MAESGFYAIDGTVGVGASISHTTAEPQFVPGTTVRLNENRAAVYVEAGQILSTSAAVAINTSFTASASAGGYIALGSGNAGDFLWVRTSGAAF